MNKSQSKKSAAGECGSMGYDYAKGKMMHGSRPMDRNMHPMQQRKMMPMPPARKK